MHFSVEYLTQKDVYKLLTATVTPRPIAWVTSNNANGGVNAAPFSFFNVMGSEPPLVVFSIAKSSVRTKKRYNRKYFA
ncbi:flavin reductase family protein [Bartonella tamiae]|uniref:Flavin reductase like domain-containing protein n=1 Tax=Bartonella tamiae Th239 TaxID=1094558 RepID=J0ZQT4_9HYPH|nr:flavin reductase [Bartonella tamiae]EJF91028.1 hypothetical protein ME5_00360 [Bartonella tamiae Th239]EJF93307.1 hypothetical protein MEG_01521 [Bartonella tamiae Th307]